MKTLIFMLTILNTYQIIQAKAVFKRSLDMADLSNALSEEKLPREVVPTDYTLDIFPIPEESYFKGTVTINLLWQEGTNKIVLHADPNLVLYQSELDIIENESPSRAIKILRSEKDPERSWYTIYLRRPVSAGSQARLSIAFTGTMNSEVHKGLFVSTYEDTTIGETKYFVGSYFKPNFARKVFPCFDEPEFKTPFKISVVRKESMNALSNMPAVRSEPLSQDPSWVRDYFQETYPMATYSLGILVSDFTAISPEDEIDGEKNFDATIQVWATPDNMEEAQNFSKVIAKAVNDIGEILNQPYPLPKLDYVFVPSVESDNWGLIVQSHGFTPEIVYNLVSQWIGHAVTPSVWNAETITEALRFCVTVYNMQQDNEYRDAFEEQILLILHNTYDTFTKRRPSLDHYSSDANEAIKIGLYLRMLSYALGETTFIHGIGRFVVENQFKTYQEVDIWNYLTDQAHVTGTLAEDLSVSDIADSWILTSQLPVLNVKRNYRDNSAVFSQKVFQDEVLDYKWIIPLIVVKENNLEFINNPPVDWLKESSLRLTKMGSRDQFIIVNPEEIGPFPVNYDERNWKLISEFLRKKEKRPTIPYITRSKLLNDAFLLASTGELSYKTALDMILFMENEDKLIVWEGFFVAVEYVERYVSESPVTYRKYLNFLRIWFLHLHEQLENAPENDDNFYLKVALKEKLCWVGYIPCIEEARESFKACADSGGETCTNIYSDIRTLSQWGTDEESELSLGFVADRISNNESACINYQYLFKSIASCTSKPWEVERILNISIFEDVDTFADADIEKILVILGENIVGYTTLFGYLNDNWEAINERFVDNNDLMKKIIEAAISNFKTQEKLDMVKNFYTDKRSELSFAESTVETAISSVEKEVDRSTVNYRVIEEWLDAYLKNHEDTSSDTFVGLDDNPVEK